MKDIKTMSRDEIYDWVEEQKKNLSEPEFNKLMAKNGKELATRMEQLDRMRKKVTALWEKVSEFDDGVANFFDLESEEMLGKKIRVLQELIDGKSPDEIGKPYFDILEEFDQSGVRDGEVADVGGWEFDPEKYK